MAETQGKGSSIFRQSAMSRIASADDLDKYIRVTNPNAWMVLLAAILLIAGMLIWSLTAVIPTTVTVTGIYDDDQVVCWVDADTASKLSSGDGVALILNERVHDLTVSEIPLSRAEVKSSITSDFLLESVTLEDWNYAVQIEAPDSLKKDETTRPVPVSIVVSETHPFGLIFGSK